MPVVTPMFVTQNGWYLRKDSVWTSKCAADMGWAVRQG
jgi:hypothetical protein